MAKFTMPTRLVRVDWLDHVSSGEIGWKRWKDTVKQQVCLVHSVGFVVSDGDDFLTLAAHVMPEDGTNDGDVTIHKSAIKRIVDLLPVVP